MNQNGNTTLKISGMKVCALNEPLGIDEVPVFSWIAESSEENDCQRAYRLVVADENQNVVWDSGITESSVTTGVRYSGRTLKDHQRYTWKVSIWSEKSGFSESNCNSFSTGFMKKDWKGTWIGLGKTPEESRASVCLRREFHLKKPVVRAFAHICGLGFFSLSCNGKSADDSVMNPSVTQYNETVLYCTYDLTHFLQQGQNAIGVQLGNSFYNEIGGVWNWETAAWRDAPKMIFYMRICFNDGSEEVILSDSDWKATDEGPIRSNSMYYGEVYDARKQITGFDTPAFDDRNWVSAVTMKPPQGALCAQMHVPVRRIAKYKPESIVKLGENSWRVQSPQMVAGWIRLTEIAGRPGDRITLTYGQKLDTDGQVHRYGSADGELSDWYPHARFQQDVYILCGSGNECFEPTFNYKGFEYVQIDGIQGELTENQITIYRISNDVQETAEFHCSNEMLNRLHHCMKIAMSNNFEGEHCDPMLEKNGWLGDINVSLASLMFNFDMPGCLPNMIRLMEDCQKHYGLVPIMLPTADWAIENMAVWNTLLVYAINDLKNYFGAELFAIEHYDAMRTFAMRDIEDISKNGWTWMDDQLGDWVSPMGGTDPNVNCQEQSSEGSGLIGTAFVYGVLQILCEYAHFLNRENDRICYENAMHNIYQAFQEKYFDTTLKLYQTDCWNPIGKRTQYRQTSNLVALAFGLVPKEEIPAVVENLVQDIVSKDNHLDTGCVGTRYILPILCDYGYEELAYKVVTQKTYPSWGYWLEHGAKSAWEMWESTSRSLDHYFLGTYDEWFFTHLGGIRNIRNGFETFSVRPVFCRNIDHVRVKLNTVRGELISEWKRDETDNITICLTVPFSAKARIELPNQIVTVGSGRHTFQIHAAQHNHQME